MDILKVVGRWRARAVRPRPGPGASR